jgi:hypothetical protein
MAIVFGQLIQRFVQVRTRAGEPAPEVAVKAMAEEGKRIVQELLSRPGRAAPGESPGLETGELRDSIALGDVVPLGPGIAQCDVAPHTVYAGVQEFGGVIFPHGRWLHWVDAGGSTYTGLVKINRHPYMRRMRDEGLASGAFRDAAKKAWIEAAGLDEL